MAGMRSKCAECGEGSVGVYRAHCQACMDRWQEEAGLTSERAAGFVAALAALLDNDPSKASAFVRRVRDELGEDVAQRVRVSLYRTWKHESSKGRPEPSADR